MSFEKCCDKGYEWDGETIGEAGKCGGLDAYISKPAGETTKAVLLIHDIWGYEPKNPRLIADAYAKAGYLAVFPDFFRGNPWVGELDYPRLMEWLKDHETDKVMGFMDAVLKDIHGMGIEKVGVQGFCWGGLYAALLAGAEKVDAIVETHGSLLNKEIVENIKKPTLWLCCEVDQQIPPEFRKEIQEIMAKKDFPSLMKVYTNVEHGFSLRGDKKDPYITQMANDALSSAMAWFDATFSEP